MDTMITSADETAGTAETETPEQSTGTETADSETKPTEGGAEQSSTEGNQGNQPTGRRRWSLQDEVKELRASRREERARNSELMERFESMSRQLEELRTSREASRDGGTAKTPANFWQDPEARLQALRDEIRDEIGEQNKGLMEAFHQTREQEYARQEHAQEVASSTEFIRSQKGYDPSDDEDLIEIISALPKRTRDNSDPKTIAEYAWYKLQASRGVGDRGLEKRRASVVQGQPPGVGFGRKTWSRSDFDAACDMLEKNPHDPKNAELLKELESAHKEGRVK